MSNNSITNTRPNAPKKSRISKLLIPESPLQVLPTLAVAIGLNEALFLQQLHYWVRMSPHMCDGRRWVYNDYEDWHHQFPFWSYRTLRRIINRLEKPLPGCDGSLILSTTHLSRHPMDQTKWYTIDYDVLDAFCANVDSVDNASADTFPDERSDFSPWQEISTRCGQVDHISWPHRTDGIGQSGHVGCPDWPVPCGQSGHLSLQRLPETTNREKNTSGADAREAKAEDGHNPCETPVTPLTSTVSEATEETPCGVAQVPQKTLSPDIDLHTAPPNELQSTSENSTPHQATNLVRAFRHRVHGVIKTPLHPKEIEHAERLLANYGSDFATFFVEFASQTARDHEFTPSVFGGLLRYEASALEAYRHQQGQQARHLAEQAETRAAYLRAQYEQQRTVRLRAYRDTLAPDALDALKQEVHSRLEAESAGIPRAAFEAWVNVELQERLATLAEVPPFDEWLVQRETAGLAANHPAPGLTPARGGRLDEKPVRHDPPGAPRQPDVTAPGTTLHPEAHAKGTTS